MTAPDFNRLNHLTGEKVAAPSKFFEANAMADEVVAELEGLRASRADSDELQERLDDALERNLALVNRIAQLKTELRHTQTERDRAQAERDTARLKAGVM
jgi:hypothetical protein